MKKKILNGKIILKLTRKQAIAVQQLVSSHAEVGGKTPPANICCQVQKKLTKLDVNRWDEYYKKQGAKEVWKNIRALILVGQSLEQINIIADKKLKELEAKK
jgi:hypothetical protein